MPIHIKSWHKFQHFKDRRPPWVKLYRALLDDPEWHQLEPHAAKALVMLWLLASEYDGQLPEAKTIAFRLRTSVADVEAAIQSLGHWLGEGDIEPMTERYQDDAPERETEKEQRQTPRGGAFKIFWDAYPKKVGKGAAEKAFERVNVPVAVLTAAIAAQCKSEQWRKEEGRYIPMPSTWLNQRRWEDEGTQTPSAPAPQRGPDPALEKIKRDAERAAPPPQAIREQMAKLTNKFVGKEAA